MVLNNEYHNKAIRNFIVVRDSIQIGNFLFSHRPIPKKEIPKGCINVHGHIHEKESLSGINISVEKTDYKPVLLDEVEKEIIMKKDKKVRRSKIV